MRDVYLGYYQPSEESFGRLWQHGTVVLDTNVLLNLYRVSQATRDEVFELLQKLEGRLWLPYQVGLEFHRRRLSVISEQHSIYRSLQTLVQNTQEKADVRQNDDANTSTPGGQGSDRLMQDTR
jgi:hypothetical protein